MFNKNGWNLSIWVTRSLISFPGGLFFRGLPNLRLLSIGVILLLLLPLLVGCSDQVKLHPGVVTESVFGTIQAQSGFKCQKPFIIIRKHNRTLIKTSSGYLHRISAALVHPDKSGNYLLSLGAGVDQLDIIIIAEGFKMFTYQVQRSLGISKYELNVKLVNEPNWHDHFYFVIKPVLTEFITEQRYRMQQMGQLQISKWIETVEKSF